MIETWSQDDLREAMPDDMVHAILFQIRAGAGGHNTEYFGWKVHSFQVDDYSVSAIIVGPQIAMLIIQQGDNITREQMFHKAVTVTHNIYLRARDL